MFCLAYINMFARFNENPAMTLQDIKETKRYRQTDAQTDNVKTVYPLQTKFAGGIKTDSVSHRRKQKHKEDINQIMWHPI